MLQEGNTWSVDVFFNPLDCDCPHIVTQQVTVAGSILVDGKTYKRVFNNDGETDCLVREENGIVYQLDFSNPDEVLKYDFTLELGDFFNFQSGLVYCSYGCFNNTGVNTLEVVDVDTQFIAGENRKVIMFEFTSQNNPTFFQEVWIEGIGSTRGFDPLGECVDITDWTALVCFDINGTNYFFNDATSCDNTTLGIDDFNQDQIVLYPNPSSSKIFIKSQEDPVTKVELYSLLGENVITVNNNVESIDISDLDTGIYLLKIYTERGTTIKKIIKK